VQGLVGWHHGLPVADAEDSRIKVELVAALMVVAL
jgi:hypothetical protein